MKLNKLKTFFILCRLHFNFSVHSNCSLPNFKSLHLENMDIEVENLPIISANQINKILDYKSLTEAVSDGLACYSKGKESGINQPVRTVIPVPKNQG